MFGSWHRMLGLKKEILNDITSPISHPRFSLVLPRYFFLHQIYIVTSKYKKINKSKIGGKYLFKQFFVFLGLTRTNILLFYDKCTCQ
jgi:hypothetical protein